jgi:hypothetical protein
MKIIAIDDLGRESIPDVLIATNVNSAVGERLVDFLNSRSDDVYFYKLVRDEHKLWKPEY